MRRSSELDWRGWCRRRLHFIDRAGWGCRNQACLPQPDQPFLSQLQPPLTFENERETFRIIRETEVDPDRLSHQLSGFCISSPRTARWRVTWKWGWHVLFPLYPALHKSLFLMEKNELIKNKVKLKWRQFSIYKSVFWMQKGFVQTVLFHQRWCKDISHQTAHLAGCTKTGQGGGEEDEEVEEYSKLIVSYLLLLFLFQVFKWEFALAFLFLSVKRCRS